MEESLNGSLPRAPLCDAQGAMTGRPDEGEYWAPYSANKQIAFC